MKQTTELLEVTNVDTQSAVSAAASIAVSTSLRVAEKLGADPSVTTGIGDELEVAFAEGVGVSDIRAHNCRQVFGPEGPPYHKYIKE